MPAAATPIDADCPDRMPMLCGCSTITGVALAAMTTSAVLEFAVPTPVTRSQKFVSTDSAGVVNCGEVAPPIGADVSPLTPWNHWKLNGPVPVATTFNTAAVLIGIA